MILYIITTLFTYLIYKIYTWTRCPKEIEHIPSLPITSFFKFYLSNESYSEKIKKEIQPMGDKYGVFRSTTFLGHSIIVTDPKICKEICSKPDVFVKLDISKFSVSEHYKTFFGLSNVLDSNNKEWKRHRKVINPIFNQSWSTELFGECVRDVIDEWEKKAGGEIKVHDTIQRMTLDVLGKAIFDINFSAVKDPNSRLYNLYNFITEEIFGKTLYVVLPFMEKVPYFRRPKVGKKLKEYHQFVEEMMCLKKKKLDEGIDTTSDLITAFMKSNEMEEEFKLTTNEIRDNITVFILAGHDTTSNTLSSTLYYLARYPEIQEKLRSEILEALDHPLELTTPTIDQLKNISYLDLVNKESMRIMTTVTNLQREAIRDYTLSNGLTIPKDTTIFFNLWAIHHNSNYFSKPEEFKPDRFKEISSDENRNWQPFLTGPRSCIGTTFSLMEQRVAIVMLLQKFEFSISKNNPDYDKLRITHTGIVRPLDLSLTVKPRI